MRKPVSIWCDHHLPRLLRIELIWLLIVACGMLSHTFQWLCKVSEYWRELENTVAHVNPEQHKYAQWVTFLVSMQAMEELGHFQLPGVVYRSLRHGAVHYHAET